MSNLSQQFNDMDETHLAMSDPIELAKYIMELKEEIDGDKFGGLNEENDRNMDVDTFFDKLEEVCCEKDMMKRPRIVNGGYVKCLKIITDMKEENKIILN